MEPSLQDKYAELLKCPDKKYLDEVAFSLAHISPQVLKDPSFDPSLIWENVRQIYEADKIVEFAELVEKGDYTYFWREYFLLHREESYPRLRDYLKGVKLLWNCKPLSIPHEQLEENPDILNYALPVIGLWVMKQLPNPRSSRGRPLQPIGVLMGHGGSCTENQSALACALRACLIPAAYAKNFSENHEWVEFFLLGKWYPIQTDMGGACLQIALPQNISSDKDFGGVKELSSVSLVRPDGYLIERIGGHSKTIRVKVKLTDKKGNPLDGVPVMIFTPYYPAVQGNCDALATYRYTDINGRCEFTLGQNRDYLIRVEDEGFFIRNASEGKVYQHTFVLRKAKQTLEEILSPLPLERSSPSFSIFCRPHSYIMYGMNLLPDFRRPEVRPTFSQKLAGGSLTILNGFSFSITRQKG